MNYSFICLLKANFLQLKPHEGSWAHTDVFKKHENNTKGFRRIKENASIANTEIRLEFLR